MAGGFRTDLTIAGRNLLQHTRRNLFLGGALAMVTLLFALLNGLSTGVKETMVRTATTLETGHVNVGGFFKITSGQSAPVVTHYQKVLDAIRKEVPELDYVSIRGRGWAKAVSDTATTMSGIGGIDITREPGFRKVVQVETGNLDDMAHPGTLLLFRVQADKLGVKVGDTVTLSAPTSRGVNNVIDVRVAVIAKNVGLLGQWNVFIHEASLRQLYQINDDATSVLMLHLKRIDDMGPVAERLRGSLAKAGWKIMEYDPVVFWMKFDKVNREAWTGQKLDITTWKDELSFFMWVLTALDALTAILITILLIIVVVGIMNTMWIAIRERTREIGTLRAIGMQRRQVLRLFLLEAILLGLAGTVAGAVLAALLGTTVNALKIPVPDAVQLFLMSDHLFFAIHPAGLVKAILGITLVTGLAALYPSLRAARLKPVVAMGHAG